MNEKKSNAPLITVVVIVALLLLVVPCALGSLFLAGLLVYQSAPAPPPQQPSLMREPIQGDERSPPRPDDLLPNK